MVAHITYTKTTRGQRAFTKELPDAVGQVLAAMDGDLTEDAILAKLHDVSESAFREAMTWLLEGGFVRLSDAEPFVISQPSALANDAIQVDEISFDEFDALSNTVSPKRKKESTTEADIVFNLFAETVAEKSTKFKKRSKAEKEKARLEAIEATKRITAAKAEERARLNAETEVQKQAEVLAKKEQWAKLKAEAEEKALAEKKAQAEAAAMAKAQAEIQARERSEAEAKKDAEKWAQLKAAAKAKADEEAQLAAIATAKNQIKLQRFAKKIHSTLRIKQGVIALLRTIKSLFIFLLLVLCLLVSAAHLMNIPMLTKPIEKMVSEKIDEKVEIASVHIRLLPKPHLLLDTINIANTSHAEKIRVYPNFIDLKHKLVSAFSTPDKTPYKIQSLSIEGLTIAQKDFAQLRTWTSAIAKHQQPIFHHLVFKDLSLNMNGLTLPPLQVDVSLSSIDAFKKAVFSTKEKDFNLTMHAIKDGYLIDINATNWRTPLSPFPIFTTLNATGVVKNNDLSFSSITGQLYGGTLSAKLETNLSSPRLASKGRFTLNGIAINKLADDIHINAAITGHLNTNGYFAFNVNQTNNTINSPNIDAAFKVKNGVLEKIDIAEAMRTKNINGSTKFTTLTGRLSLNNNSYRLTNLSLRDNQLQAYGQVTISANEQVSASISSTIAIPNNPISKDLMIKGSINALKVIN